MPTYRQIYRFALFVVLAASAMLYAPGLDGPFLFDDHVHITQNRWVKIDQLDWQSLSQAWNSSFSAFPSNRPLAQVSFGITHAVAGLDAWAFKAVNLAIHLFNGLLVYLLVRLVHRVLRDGDDGGDGRLLALSVAALWAAHPLHVSTVLYTVQRMALLSTACLLLATLSYTWGRLQLARGHSGCGWMFAAAPLAMLGFLGKENAASMPLLLLSLEATLLARMGSRNRALCMTTIRGAFIALPLLAALVYLWVHPGLLSYDQRPFTLEERLLTQPRVLWTYVRWLLVPDISAFGLFHDDLVVSRGWLQPPVTIIAAAALLGVTVAALMLRRRWPVFAFAVFFFLANHALESSVFPLEMMFEHRNYLASVGPLLLLGYLIVHVAARFQVARAAAFVGVLLLVSYATVTAIRVGNWSSYEGFVFNAVENHPQSRRSNFMAAQLLISAISKSHGDPAPLAEAAARFLDQGLRIDPRCLDCLFAKIALDLQLGRQPPRAVIDRLVAALSDGDVGPTYVSVGQFTFLARWHKADGHKLPRDDVEAIFDAALGNPAWILTGRAAVTAAYREYHEFVTGDLERAERLARAAVAAWPAQWGYHVHLLRVLGKRGLHAAAARALREAEHAIKNAEQQREFDRLRDNIEHELKKPPNGSERDAHRTEHHPAGPQRGGRAG